MHSGVVGISHVVAPVEKLLWQYQSGEFHPCPFIDCIILQKARCTLRTLRLSR
jgi:hypothetical protein